MGQDQNGNTIIVPSITPLDDDGVKQLLSHYTWFASSTPLTNKPHHAVTDSLYGEEMDMLEYIPQPQHLPSHEVSCVRVCVRVGG